MSWRGGRCLLRRRRRCGSGRGTWGMVRMYRYTRAEHRADLGLCCFASANGARLSPPDRTQSYLSALASRRPS